MPHRVFYSVDLAAWVYRTIEKHRQGTSWPRAWVETYREIGGATSSGEKICPMPARRSVPSGTRTRAPLDPDRYAWAAVVHRERGGGALKLTISTNLLQAWAVPALGRPLNVSSGVGHGFHLAAREHRRLIRVIRRGLAACLPIRQD